MTLEKPSVFRFLGLSFKNLGDPLNHSQLMKKTGDSGVFRAVVGSEIWLTSWDV